MNPTSDFATNQHLRVFVGSEAETVPLNLNLQLPFIEDLFEQFESVTGWTLSFNETRSSQINRSIDANSTIFGELEIDDMSSHIEAGRSARHRGYCDQLAQTLDCMVHIIQADRHRFRSLDQHLSTVVDLPFEWWGIGGRSGYRHGMFASWSVSHDEKIRAFAGRVIGNDMQSSVLSSAAILATFETACQMPMSLEQIAPVVSAVKQRSSMFNAKLDWFSTIELDPVTGEFELDGYDATQGTVLIDVDAQSVVELASDELNGVVYSGQVLVIGVTDETKDRLRSLVEMEETTSSLLVQKLQNEFADDPMLFLFRR